MIFEFGDFELDHRRAELRQGKIAVPLEPRAFTMLCLLVENHDRLVTKEEIVEKAWDGRFVSDAAIATVIKSVRRALGDDGTAQRFVRTVRGRGFRFVAPVRIQVSAEPLPEVAAAAQASTADERSSRPSIAILPFTLLGYSEEYGAIADAIPSELISSLSRLRWLWVIARGSAFRFRGRDVDVGAIRASLGARYCLCGVVEIFGKSVTVAVELTDTESQVVVWSERFPSKIDAIQETRTAIVGSVIAALELHIPLNEANKARLQDPRGLDAWSEYHVGLQHMYRFNQSDNEIAAARFERATTLDPTFARAYAGRSFTSFQSAFLKYAADTAKERDNARRFAERSLELDPLDPFGNFNLGRTHWLDGDPDGGLECLDRAVIISPNFAQGHYAKAWTDVMAGRGGSARSSVDTSMGLSPLDPFLYAMQATRAFGFLLEGDFAEAARWAEKGARAPGAHFLIGAIAIAAHRLNGDARMADYWLASVRKRRKDASVEHFFTAFPFSDAAVRQRIGTALRESGL